MKMVRYVQFVVIHGIGDVGKAMHAVVIYNRLRHHFDMLPVTLITLESHRRIRVDFGACKMQIEYDS